MISFQFDVDDLAGMRFACSPLLETATSLWALHHPERYAPHLPWSRQARLAVSAAPDIDAALLEALVAPELDWLPDFITPRPTSPLPDVTDELRRVRATNPDRALTDLLGAYAGQPLPPVLDRLRVDPRLLRDTIADTLTAYWRVAVEPHWPRMRALLEADMLHRARSLARDGAAALLTDLDPSASWTNGNLHIHISHHLHHHITVAGRGLWLVPTLFATHAISSIGPDEPPTVAYPARGVGLLWESVPPRPPDALAELIGRPRARLLAALDAPASTTDLAARLGVTPSAVSQHLAVLHRTGLVTRSRTGRVVLYTRTELAAALATPARPG